MVGKASEGWDFGHILQIQEFNMVVNNFLVERPEQNQLMNHLTSFTVYKLYLYPLYVLKMFLSTFLCRLARPMRSNKSIWTSPWGSIGSDPSWKSEKTPSQCCGTSRRCGVWTSGRTCVTGRLWTSGCLMFFSWKRKQEHLEQKHPQTTYTIQCFTWFHIVIRWTYG